jgi:hypothetical protein
MIDLPGGFVKSSRQDRVSSHEIFTSLAETIAEHGAQE